MQGLEALVLCMYALVYWGSMHLMVVYPNMLQEGFGLSSSPGLRGRRAGQDVILPVV